MNDTINLEKLNQRQVQILNYLLNNSKVSHEDVVDIIPVQNKPTRVTISRDLKELVDLGYITAKGKTKGVSYFLNPNKVLLSPFDIDEYYKKSADERKVAFSKFNPQIFDYIKGSLFEEEELAIFAEGKNRLTETLKNQNDIYVRKELERFVIELSWKSSQIEGNTYSLLETEELIKFKKEAKGHDRFEAIMILNHKSVFDAVLQNRENYVDISLHDIRSIHSVLVKNMDIPTGLREKPVGITGTQYHPPDNKWQITEHINELLDYLKKIEDVPSKAFLLLAFISYLQPFADGNKRTARMVSNAILIANNYFPLSYRSVNEIEFKRALLVFYEQNNLYHLKRIFLEQQKFAIENYWRN